MRWSEPIVRVGEMFADSKAESTFASSRSPGSYDVALRSCRNRIPPGLMFRVPHVEVVVVDSHGEEVFCTGFDVEIHEVVGVPAGSFELRNQIFVANFGGMAVGLDVVVVLVSALDVHVARIPIAVFN